MSLLVPAYPGCPGSKAVKRSLLLYRLTRVVLEKEPLNVCVCVRACVRACVCGTMTEVVQRK